MQNEEISTITNNIDENYQANKDIKLLPIYSMAHGLPIIVTRLSNDHPIYLIENFLTPEECDYVIQYGDAKLKPSTAVENDKLVIPSYRTSTTAFITECGKVSDDEILKKIQLRASAFSWFPIKHIESLNLTRYQYNQKYDIHADYFDPSNVKLLGIAKQRVCTFFVYLNDLPEDAGGHTIFPKLNISIRPVKGNAVFWLNTGFDGTLYPITKHMGEVIRKEDVVKYAMNIWIRQNAYF